MVGKITFLEFLESVRTFRCVMSRFIASVTNNFRQILFRVTVRIRIEIGPIIGLFGLVTIAVGPVTILGLF